MTRGEKVHLRRSVVRSKASEPDELEKAGLLIDELVSQASN